MKSKSIMGALLAGAIGLAASAAPALAGAINPNTWYIFSFDANGTPLTSGNITGTNPFAPALDAPAWTFTLGGPATLLVTDLQTSGDYFTFYDFGIDIGTTATGVENGTTACANDIGCALADANYGKGLFLLGAGDHSLTGLFNGTIQFGSGALIVQEIPEPLTLSLFGAGLAGAAVLRRRKKSA